MDHHTRILQERIEVASLSSGRNQPLERIGDRQHEQKKSDTDEAHHAENTRPCGLGKMRGEQRDRKHPDGQDQRP